VDIDTSDQKFRDLPFRAAYQLRCLEKGCPNDPYQSERAGLCSTRTEPNPKLVAALDEEMDRVIKHVVWLRGVEGDKDRTLGPMPVLGGIAPDARHRTAIVAVRPDPDGRLREFPEDLPGEPAWEKAAAELKPNVVKTAGVKARPLLTPALIPGVLGETTAGELVAAGPIEGRKWKGKVVFLGGRYEAGDSFYLTDGRRHPGVVVLAAATLAHANQNFIIEAKWLEWLVKIFLALAVIFLNHAIETPWQRLALVVLLFIGTCAVFVMLSVRMGWVLSLAGLMLSLLVEQTVEGTLSAKAVEKHADG
jgi:hypothetical protein